MPNTDDWHRAPDPAARFDINATVGWYEGLHERTGRVIRNLPAAGRQPAVVVVRDTSGADHRLQVTKVWLKNRTDYA